MQRHPKEKEKISSVVAKLNTKGPMVEGAITFAEPKVQFQGHMS